MGDERWGGTSLFNPYRSNDIGSQVSADMLRVERRAELNYN
jgi:hypothetical protein